MSNYTNNFIGGEITPPVHGSYMPVLSPIDDTVISQVAVSTSEDVDAAVFQAQKAFTSWSTMTVKSRAAIMFRLHHLIEQHVDELADLVVRENGKNRAEAIASIAKGNETVEWACSLPQLIQGKILPVSRGITCQEERQPLGVVTCIVPFNFPIMVPMWTIPIALTTGNCVILKPSEKVPMTMLRVAELMKEAGIPPGVFQIVNGTVDSVNSLIEHPDVSAVTFVGSSKVAEIVSKKSRDLNKRCIALGGAKNHLIALPDCDPDQAAQDIVASFAGCCGQRCMAASVLVLVGGDHSQTQPILDKVIQKASALQPGVNAGQVGPVIDNTSKERILSYINDTESLPGSSILLDGRSWCSKSPGTWFGPTITMHTNPMDPCLREEIFGPVLSVIRVDTWEEAIAIENGNPYGNAACIYTSVGLHADWFTSRFRAAMLGVNIGIPVPREPFSFGGLYGTMSKYGDMDITGDGCMEFFTNRRKITSKWTTPNFNVGTFQSSSTNSSSESKKKDIDINDKANFNGQM